MHYTYITTVTEAKAQLSKLLEQVQDGNEIVIGKAGKPIAVLSPYVKGKHRRKAGGGWEGKVEMAEDFDEYNEALFRSGKSSFIPPRPL